MIVDLFAGPGGWDKGAELAGLSDPLGLELDDWACATREAAGLWTLQTDVSELPPDFHTSLLECEGVIASPPCPAFSKAGKREGIEHIPALLSAIRGGVWSARPSADPRVWLSLEVGRWVEALQPRWVACEQVPEVLPLWQAYEAWLRARGYSTWSGTLEAERYGVPQTRDRAILIASLDRQVQPPEPTHQRYVKGEPARHQATMFGELLPWVSMAEALGWDGEDTPARTVTGHRQPRWMYADEDGTRGRMVGFPRLDDRGDSPDGYRERDWRSEDEPSFTLTEKARSATVRSTQMEGATERALDEPAPTVTGGKSAGNLVLNTGRDWKPGGTSEDAQKLPVSSLAPSLTAKSGEQWQFHRPATTVACDERLWPPGHKENSSDPPGVYQQRRGERARKLTLAEALLLQSFPADYPVQGNKTKQFEQVGNAIPPLLAAAVLRAVAA